MANIEDCRAVLYSESMNRIDESKQFKPVNIAVLTVSDTRTLETDKSGDTLVERIARDGHVLADRAIVTDSRS